MRVLIAEDEPVSRRLLEIQLERAGYEITAVADGGQAWEVLTADDAPRLAVLDWMMPVIDGLEICRRVRADTTRSYVYIVLLTARSRDQDRETGFHAGADDFLTKPFEAQDLRSRLAVGKRILELQSALEARLAALEQARGEVVRLQGLLPICMHCKRIRDDTQRWTPLEQYIERHSDASFTHSLCCECLARHYPEVARDGVSR